MIFGQSVGMGESNLDRFFSVMQDRVYCFVTDFFFQQILKAIGGSVGCPIVSDFKARVEIGVKAEPAGNVFFPESEIFKDRVIWLENDLGSVRLALFAFFLRVQNASRKICAKV